MSDDNVGNWLPLESNPEVLNPFCARLGIPPAFGFADVFGLDEELLMMVPQPCLALCLLYPSDKISAVRRADMASRVADQPAPPPELFFVQQHDGIGNACGTIAVLHSCLSAQEVGCFLPVNGQLCRAWPVFTGLERTLR